MENKMMTLNDVLNELKKQDTLELERKNKEMANKVRELISKTEMLLTEDLSDKIVVGSLVSLKIDFGDDDIEEVSYYLGMDFSKDTISIYSLLGSSIYGANVNDTVTYSVNNEVINATILSKNKVEEDSKKLLLDKN